MIRVVLAFLSLAALLPAATFTMSISAPSEQATFIGLALTETFNAPTTGIKTDTYTGAIGTYQLNATSALAILTTDQYGGASGSQYASFGAQSGTVGAVVLDLIASYNYFGFWWSAGDANNGISFYDGSSFLARISTNDVTNRLSPQSGQVQAVDGNFYNNSLYYGNPNNLTQNTGEPYAYISLVAAGITFNRVVFDNSGSAGTGFESDNHSVYAGNVNLPGTSVLISTTSTVPEPAGLFLCGAGLIVLGLYRRR